MEDDVWRAFVRDAYLLPTSKDSISGHLEKIKALGFENVPKYVFAETKNAMNLVLCSLSNQNFLSGDMTDVFFCAYSLFIQEDSVSLCVGPLLVFERSNRRRTRSGLLMCALKVITVLANVKESDDKEARKEKASSVAYDFRCSILGGVAYSLRLVPGEHNIIWARLLRRGLDCIPVYNENYREERIKYGLDSAMEKAQLMQSVCLFLESKSYQPEYCYLVSSSLRLAFRLPQTIDRAYRLDPNRWFDTFLTKGEVCNMEHVFEVYAWVVIVSHCGLGNIPANDKVETLVVSACRWVTPACVPVLYAIAKNAFLIGNLSQQAYVLCYCVTCYLSPVFCERPVVTFTEPVDTMAEKIVLGYPWWDASTMEEAIRAVAFVRDEPMFIL